MRCGDRAVTAGLDIFLTNIKIHEAPQLRDDVFARIDVLPGSGYRSLPPAKRKQWIEDLLGVLKGAHNGTSAAPAPRPTVRRAPGARRAHAAAPARPRHPAALARRDRPPRRRCAGARTQARAVRARREVRQARRPHRPRPAALLPSPPRRLRRPRPRLAARVRPRADGARARLEREGATIRLPHARDRSDDRRRDGHDDLRLVQPAVDRQAAADQRRGRRLRPRRASTRAARSSTIRSGRSGATTSSTPAASCRSIRSPPACRTARSGASCARRSMPTCTRCPTRCPKRCGAASASIPIAAGRLADALPDRSRRARSRAPPPRVRRAAADPADDAPAAPACSRSPRRPSRCRCPRRSSSAFLESLPFTLTGAQQRVLFDVLNDLPQAGPDEPPDPGRRRQRQDRHRRGRARRRRSRTAARP